MASFEGQNLQSDKRKKKNKVKGNIIHILACYIYILCYFAQGILQRNRICYACRVKWDKQKPSKIPWCCIAQTALCFKRNHEGMMALQSFSWTFLLFAPLVSCLLPLSSLFLFSYCLLLVSYHSPALAESPCPQGDNPCITGSSLPRRFHLGQPLPLDQHLPRSIRCVRVPAII